MRPTVNPTPLLCWLMSTASACPERTLSNADPALRELQLAPPQRLRDPCGGMGSPRVHADSQLEVIIGCDNGAGLWHSTDGGDSFIQSHPSEALHVFDIDRFRDGDLWVCGHDTNGALLYRGQAGGPWEAVLATRPGSASPQTAELSSCGAIAEGPTGQPVVASLTQGPLAWSRGQGAAWDVVHISRPDDAPARRHHRHLPALLVGIDGQLYGTGGHTGAAPVFFASQAADHPPRPRLSRVQIDPRAAGEVWALASPDRGLTWLAGGRERAAPNGAGGMLYISSDRGARWHRLELPEGVANVRQIAFSNDGLHGVAVGHRLPISAGGFALFTNDGGRSWHTAHDRLPLLDAAAVVDDTYWLAGDAYLSRGRF